MANGMNESAHVAVVLAAGGSRRLGQPKQLLQRGGETLVHRAVRLAAATAPRRLLVVVGAYRVDVGAVLRDQPCELVENHEWEQGLSSSLRCAARALEDSDGSILLLGCDQPALELAHLRALLASAAQSKSGCAATAHNEVFGIPAVATPALLQQAKTLVGDRGLRALLNASGRERLGVLRAPELAFDLDTPADVRLAIARGLLDQASMDQALMDQAPMDQAPTP